MENQKSRTMKNIDDDTWYFLQGKDLKELSILISDQVIRKIYNNHIIKTSDRLLNIKDAAKEMQCGTRTVRAMIERGDLKPGIVGKKKILIKRSEIDNYLFNKK